MNIFNYLAKLIAALILITNYKFFLKFIFIIYVISFIEAVNTYLRGPAYDENLSLHRPGSYFLYEANYVIHLAWHVKHLYIYILYRIICLEELLASKTSNTRPRLQNWGTVLFVLIKRLLVWVITGLSPRLIALLKVVYQTLSHEKEESLQVFLINIIEALFMLPKISTALYKHDGKWYHNNDLLLILKKFRSCGWTAKDIRDYPLVELNVGFEKFTLAKGPNTTRHYISTELVKGEDELVYLTNYESAIRTNPAFYNNTVLAQCLTAKKPSSLLCQNSKNFEAVPKNLHIVGVKNIRIYEAIHFTGAEGISRLNNEHFRRYEQCEDHITNLSLRLLANKTNYVDLIRAKHYIATSYSFEVFEYEYNNL